MRFIVSLLLIMALSFICGLYMQWWGFALAAFVVSVFIPQGRGSAFLTGFLSIFLLWGVLALWLDYKNNSILSHKIAQVLPLGGSAPSLILLTAFIGALVGGFAALTASYLRLGMQKTGTGNVD